MLKEPAEFIVIPRYLYSLTFKSNFSSKKNESFLFTLHFFCNVIHLISFVLTSTLCRNYLVRSAYQFVSQAALQNYFAPYVMTG